MNVFQSLVIIVLTLALPFGQRWCPGCALVTAQGPRDQDGPCTKCRQHCPQPLPEWPRGKTPWGGHSCCLLPAGSLSLSFPSQVWSEERAVCDDGHADRLQLPADLLEELWDVYRAVFPCRHGPDFQLCGSICPGYGHQFGVEYLILCFTIIPPPTFWGQLWCPSWEVVSGNANQGSLVDPISRHGNWVLQVPT